MRGRCGGGCRCTSGGREAWDHDLSDAQDREDRRKHLDLITAVIGRMATASFAAKGWTITLVTAAFGTGVVKDEWALYLGGLVALGVFFFLDLRYLETEKRFRDMYDAVLDNSVAPLSMDVSSIQPRATNPTYLSWSISYLYAPLAVLGVILMTVSIFG